MFLNLTSGFPGYKYQIPDFTNQQTDSYNVTQIFTEFYDCVLVISLLVAIFALKDTELSTLLSYGRFERPC